MVGDKDDALDGDSVTDEGLTDGVSVGFLVDSTYQCGRNDFDHFSEC